MSLKALRRRKLLVRGRAVFAMLDSMARLTGPDDRRAVEIRMGMYHMCLAFDSPKQANDRMWLMMNDPGFNEWHDDCDYCALIYAQRRDGRL